MYIEHFGLRDTPFKITPDTEFFFGGGARQEILDALVYAIDSGAGIIKVVGEVGSGKTVLCRMLETQLPDNTNIVYLANPSIAPSDILNAIAFDLDISFPVLASQQQLLEALHRYLVAQHRANNRVVIFIEEAQAMPIETLEEIRLLSNIETQHEKLLQIVLFGQPELDQKLKNDEIRQLRERISHAYTLNPLNAEEIGNYLAFRIEKAGYVGQPLFTTQAIKQVAKASNGLIRRVNIIADKMLFAAYSDNSAIVNSKHAHRAIKDCEFCRPDDDESPRQNMKTINNVGLAIACTLLTVILIFYAGSFNRFIVEVGSHSVLSFLNINKEDLTSADNTLQVDNQETRFGAEKPAHGRLIQARLDTTTDWLVREADHHYCIQIMAIPHSGHPQLEQFLRRLREDDRLNKIHIYQPIINDRRGFGVLYGTYVSKADAHAEMAEVSKKYKLKSPYLRTINGINNEIFEISGQL